MRSPVTQNKNALDVKEYSKSYELENTVSRRVSTEVSSDDEEQEEEEEDNDVVDVENSPDNTIVFDEESMDEGSVLTENKGQQKQKANESNSVDTGKELFEWIIKPMTEKQFMK